MTKKKIVSKKNSNSKCRVFVHNDDVTPLDVVLDMLMTVFCKDVSTAMNIIARAEDKGKALCGIYKKENAEMLLAKVQSYAEKNNVPLICTAEVF